MMILHYFMKNYLIYAAIMVLTIALENTKHSSKYNTKENVSDFESITKTQNHKRTIKSRKKAINKVKKNMSDGKIILSGLAKK